MTKDNRLKILQVGPSNWSEIQEIPENMKWYYCNLGQLETLQETIEEDEIKAFTAVIVDSLEGLEELMAIKEYLIPHTIFFDQTIEVPDESLLQFLKEVCAVPTDFSNQGQLLFTLSKALFSGQYGDKMSPFTTQVNPNFTGEVTYHGHESVILKVIMVKILVQSWTGPIMSEPARKILSSFGWNLKKRRLASVV